MNLLITNDDGFHARGINLLADGAMKAGHNVTIVAPDREKSACSHALTMDTPLTVKKIQKSDPAIYAVSGTPADCVKLGLTHLLKDSRIDFVLSGINIGANLGSDIVYSGTVNAALEANMMGIPAIAFSQAIDRTNRGEIETHLKTAAELSIQIVDYFKADKMQNYIYNINFPAVSKDRIQGIKICSQGVSVYDEAYEKRTDPFGREYYWISGQMMEHEYNEQNETDVYLCRKGYISITPLQWNQTAAKEIIDLKCKIEQIKLHL